jgi:hypothetical protein
LAQLTQEHKREIARRLGYHSVAQEGTDKHDYFGPDGRHRAIFRPSRAADTWVWNDAVFTFELYRRRDGLVFRRDMTAPETYILAALWPEQGPPDELSREVMERDYERLGGGGLG